MYPTPAPVIGQNPFQNNIMTVKKFFAKPIILIYAILYTVSAAISLYVTYQTSKSSFVISVNGQQSTEITLIVSAVISLVFCFALFYIYIRSKNPDPAVLPNAGFTILQVFAIFMVVIFSICVAVLVFAGVIIGFVGIGDLGLYWDEIVSQIPQFSQFDSYMISADSFVTALTIAIFVIAAIVAIVLSYYIAALRFVASAKSNMRNLTMRVKGSTYFGVLTLIVAIFSTLGLLLTIGGSSLMRASTSSMSSMYDMDSLMGSGSSALNTVVSVLGVVNSYILAIIALSYSGYIKRNAGTAYAVPAVAAVPFVPMAAGQYANPYAAPTAPMAVPGAPAAPVATPTAPTATPVAPVATPAAPAATPTAPAATPAAPVATPAAPVVETPAPAEAPAPTPAEAPAPTAEAESAESAKESYGYTQEPYMPQTTYCPNCGSPIEAGSSFCINCGTRI